MKDRLLNFIDTKTKERVKATRFPFAVAYAEIRTEILPLCQFEETTLKTALNELVKDGKVFYYSGLNNAFFSTQKLA